MLMVFCEEFYGEVQKGNPDQLKQNYNVPDLSDFTYVTSVSCMNVSSYIDAPPHANCERPVNGLRGTGTTDVFFAKYNKKQVETSSNLPATKFLSTKLTGKQCQRTVMKSILVSQFVSMTMKG